MLINIFILLYIKCMISKKTLIYLLSWLALWLVVVFSLSLTQKNQQVQVMTETLTPLVQLEQLRFERVNLQAQLLAQKSWLLLLQTQDNELVEKINNIKKSVRDELNLY